MGPRRGVEEPSRDQQGGKHQENVSRVWAGGWRVLGARGCRGALLEAQPPQRRPPSLGQAEKARQNVSYRANPVGGRGRRGQRSNMHS